MQDRRKKTLPPRNNFPLKHIKTPYNQPKTTTIENQQKKNFQNLPPSKPNKKLPQNCHFAFQNPRKNI